ncbi:hypothetical protein FRC12_016296 [Ceratobasidium sp. 428]|nr:hypothetical protein FRC12_016296 [Ceratobasidium sp. 428]
MQSSEALSERTLGTPREPSLADVRDEEKGTDIHSDVPDGGWTAWMTTAGSYVGAFGVYQDYYTRTFMTNQSASAISWIGSTQIGLVFMMGSISGKLLDMGYFHWCIGVGSALHVFCLFMLSLAHEQQYYQVFLPQAIGLGIGQGLLFLPSIGVISHHFAKKRSLAMGIVFTGSSCGGMIFPIMLNNIIKRAGFAWGVRATAFVVLACLVAANLMMKTRLPPKTNQNPAHKSDFKGIMTHGVFLLTVFGTFLSMLGIWYPIFYIQLFAVRHNLDQNLSFYALTILNAASILGRTIPNFISDRIGVFNVMIPCTAIAGVLVFAMFGVKSSGALVVFAILYGFFSGSFFSLMSPMIVALARHVHEVGVRLGFAFTFIGIATLIGTPISGALLTDDYLWYRPIIFAGIAILTGATCLTIARSMHVGHKGHACV